MHDELLEMFQAACLNAFEKGATTDFIVETGETDDNGKPLNIRILVERTDKDAS